MPVAALWFLLQFATPRLLWRLPVAGAIAATVAVWAVAAVVYVVVLRRPEGIPRRLVDGPLVAVGFVVATLVFSLVAYPLVDDRRESGAGSDADDAVLIGVDQLLDGEDPYALDTYLGNPPTNGPGSLVWFVPWSTRTLYPIGNVLAVAITIAVLQRRRRSWVEPTLVALLVASSPAYWEGLAQGSDHIPFACALACSAIVFDQRERLGGFARLSWTKGIGLLATVRAAFFFVPALVGIARWRDDRRAAVVIGGLGTLVVLAWHGLFIAVWGWDGYDPIQQVLVKRDEDLSTAGQLVVLVCALAGGLVVLRELRSRLRLPRLDVVLLAGVAGPMVGIALGSLATTQDLGEWSGANYALDTVVLTGVWAAGLAAAKRRTADA